MEKKKYRVIIWGGGRCYSLNRKLLTYLVNEGQFEIVAGVNKYCHGFTNIDG